VTEGSNTAITIGMADRDSARHADGVDDTSRELHERVVPPLRWRALVAVNEVQGVGIFEDHFGLDPHERPVQRGGGLG
jgi:hypothetical protein